LRLKILKKLRTASLNSEFTGSYKKKSVIMLVLNKICPNSPLSKLARQQNKNILTAKSRSPDLNLSTYSCTICLEVILEIPKFHL